MSKKILIIDDEKLLQEATKALSFLE